MKDSATTVDQGAWCKLTPFYLGVGTPTGNGTYTFTGLYGPETFKTPHGAFFSIHQEAKQLRLCIYILQHNALTAEITCFDVSF
jgi:hypothetical protein